MKKWHALGALVAMVATACVVAIWSNRCSDAVMCAAGIARGGLATTLVLLGAAVLGGTLLMLVRAGILLFGASKALSELPRISNPRLQHIAKRLGCRRIEGFAGRSAVAVTAGFPQPVVYCSAGLIDALSDAQLEAVIQHELSHVQRNDPLRQALRCALSDLLFFLPIIRWWSRRCSDHAEVAADFRALQGSSPSSLAAALWISGGDGAALAAPEPRMAQLEGRTFSFPPPPRHVALQSLAGLVSAALILVCALPI